VVSQVSSLPEVCGQAAIYIKDPYSMESIREALKKVLTMSLTEKNRRVSLGLEWVKRYNWEVAAKVTLEVLEEAGQLK
jgi:trehalose-6-phosphate synthase